MSINRNRRERRKFSFVLNGACAGIYIIIITLVLLAGDFWLISPTTIVLTATPSNITGTKTTTTSSSSPEIELSSQPVYQAHLKLVGQNPINETHASVTFSGNGTLTLPNTTQTINITSNGSALVSIATESSQMKLTIKTQDGEETATTPLYVIERHPAGTTGESKGIAIAVVNTNTNATSGMLAPLEGMILVGIIESQTTTGEGQLTLWEWKS
jgi:hypothetical protein